MKWQDASLTKKSLEAPATTLATIKVATKLLLKVLYFISLCACKFEVLLFFGTDKIKVGQDHQAEIPEGLLSSPTGREVEDFPVYVPPSQPDEIAIRDYVDQCKLYNYTEDEALERLKAFDNDSCRALDSVQSNPKDAKPKITPQQKRAMVDKMAQCGGNINETHSVVSSHF